MVRKSIKSHLPLAVRQVLKELGELIALGRKERKFTQAELAERVGVSRMTIVRIERGAPEVAVGHYLTSAWILGLPILAWSDFAGVRSESSLVPFLENLRRQLPQRIRTENKALNNEF